MRKSLFLVVIAVMLLSSIAPFSAIAADPPKQWNITMLLGAVDNPHWNRMAAAGQKAADMFGAKLTVLYAENDANPAEQIAQIEDRVAAGDNAIILDCHGYDAEVPIVEKVTKQGIPVLNVDRIANTEAVVSVVQTDNEMAGYMGAKWVAEQIGGKGKIAVLEGAPGGESYTMRRAGALRALKEFPDIQLVASIPADWQIPKGQSVTEDILTANPDVNGIFACNDMMAIGAAAALKGRGLTDKVILCGLDGAKQAMEMVADGRMNATVAQFPGRMGFLSVMYAVRYLNGETVPKHVDSGEFVVTKDNAPAMVAGMYGD